MDEKYLLSIAKDLTSIPSITESEAESRPGEILYERLSALPYFRENPGHLILADTPLEGSRFRLKSLCARVDAAEKTSRTVLLIGHYDVVDVRCYGELAEYAFDTDKLSQIMKADGDTLYGRGIMDMKCGVAIETAMIEEFAGDRTMFGVNIVMTLVGDEENSSAGMRGILPLLADMCADGTDFIAAVNMEPGEAGVSGITGPMVFLGTLGKLMPSFYIRGRGAHVGNCFDGFSAALCAAHIETLAEGSAELADTTHGTCPPSWICLDMKVMRDVYSVTLPERAYIYFNCFTAHNGPRRVMSQMLQIASRALRAAAEQSAASCRAVTAMGYDGSDFKPFNPTVYTLSELTAMARKHTGAEFESELSRFIDNLPQGDMRARGLQCVDFIADRSGAEGPYVVCFFLPPWLPVRTDFFDDPRDIAAIESARAVEKICIERYGIKMNEIDFFEGLCDLSYVGGKVQDEDISALAENIPAWGRIYSVPIESMRALGLPVINLGPSGDFPHRKEERLHIDYSIKVLPELLKELITELSEHVPDVGGGTNKSKT